VISSPEDIVQAIYDAAEKGLRVIVIGGPSLGTVDLGPASLAALEEVQVNVTGEGGVSTEATLATLLAILTPGTPEQQVGTADVAMQTVTFSGPSKHVTVLNPTKNAVLEVSFDGGASFIQLHGPDVLSVPCKATEIRVRSTAGLLPYGVIAAV
jgi:hypothetical protein